MLRTYVQVSRPRFWLYLVGPYLIGVVAAGEASPPWWELVTLALYFTLPANLLVYGLSDLFDYQAGRHHSKKRGYDVPLQPGQQRQLVKSIWLWNVPLLVVWLISSLPLTARIGLLGFIFFGIFYSAPPIRAKTKPLIDGLFNSLYIFPGIVGYSLLTGQYPPVQLLAGAVIWCAAMHAFAAVADIMADSKAGIGTTATWLGRRRTLLLAIGGYAVAVLLVYPWLHLFGAAIGGLYIGMAVASLLNPQRHHVFRLHKWFALINMLAGASLFLRIILA